ncbi:MAG: pentapeptide repeat-containing protein [Leptolyngbyaceae cyanobacterium RU_5_1]|nr:pentapeptide repeat-containing protein [Leptolyngbyaceae cyanobacterium RU_5_1]
MANEEHLALIRQGVDAWNQWRRNDPELRPDLTGANLSSVNLSLADFERVNLSQSNLKWANLSQANLKWATFSQTNLKWANLSQANLSQSNLKWTDLSQANLSQANLVLVDLSQTNLSQATFIKADLRNADLSLADLSGADLTEANLSGANLTGANLNQSNLTGADLTSANLLKAQALGTNFTQAVLTTACLKDWSINSETKFDGAICDDLESNPIESSSLEDDFAKTSTVVELSFNKGIDWQAFVRSLQDLQLVYSAQSIMIQALENHPNNGFMIRFTAPIEINTAELENQVRELYETHLAALEAEYCEKLQITPEDLADYWQQSTNLIEIVKFQATRSMNVETKQPHPDNDPILSRPFEDKAQSTVSTTVKQAITAALDAYIAPAVPGDSEG